VVNDYFNFTSYNLENEDWLPLLSMDLIRFESNNIFRLILLIKLEKIWILIIIIFGI